MAEFDYGFLAEYAKVEGGTLSTIGASFTQIGVPQLPAQHLVSVAGRVRTHVDEEPEDRRLDFYFTGPGGFEFSWSMDTSSLDNVRPYGEGKIGFLFVANLNVPLLEAGLHEVRISLAGAQVRRLAFEVVVSG